MVKPVRTPTRFAADCVLTRESEVRNNLPNRFANAVPEVQVFKEGRQGRLQLSRPPQADLGRSGVRASRPFYHQMDCFGVTRNPHRTDPSAEITSCKLTFRYQSGQLPRSPFLDSFLFADYTGVGPDFVQMRAGAGYDLVRYMLEALRVGETR